jgi:uncharacterized protein YjbJ (UPF0337 family)
VVRATSRLNQIAIFWNTRRVRIRRGATINRQIPIGATQTDDKNARESRKPIGQKIIVHNHWTQNHNSNEEEFMNKDRAEGKVKDIAGRVERQVGEWTGDPEKQAHGTAKQAEGKVQNAWGKVKDTGKDIAEDARAREKNQKADEALEKEEEAARLRREAS